MGNSELEQLMTLVGTAASGPPEAESEARVG